MQRSVLKFLSTFLIVFLLTGNVLFAKTSPELIRADSLFQQKKFVQSLELYQIIFDRHQYTPAMLLKMAYVHEGLNQVGKSAYYLNMYYLATNDEKVLSKIDELASKYRLEGYDENDLDNMHAFYMKHQFSITVGLCASVIFVCVFLFVQRFGFKSKPYIAWSFLFILSTLLIIHLQFGRGRSNAIIAKSDTYLMEGPSGAASVVSIVGEGHRVKIKGRKDVWVRIEWGEEEVFVKETSLMPIHL